MPCRVGAWSIGMYHTGLTSLFGCLLLLDHKYKLVEYIIADRIIVCNLARALYVTTT